MYCLSGGLVLCVFSCLPPFLHFVSYQAWQLYHRQKGAWQGRAPQAAVGIDGPNSS